MTRRIAIVGMVILLGYLGLVVIQALHPSSEVESATDSQDFPEFLVSDSVLTHEGPVRVQARAPDTGFGPRAQTPYFIRFADGQYACGYTDAQGDTRAVFMQAPVKYSVFWNDAAWDQWLKIVKH